MVVCVRPRDDTKHRTTISWTDDVPHFHNLLIFCDTRTRNLAFVPFDDEAKQWAQTIPFERILLPSGGAEPHRFVHESSFPFLPLLWFHVFLADRKADLVEMLMHHPEKHDGTAFFELHLVDDMVPNKEPKDCLAAFNQERYEFAQHHMEPYQPIPGQ